MRVSPTGARTLFAGLRVLLVLTVILGIGYPLLVTAIAQLPGLRARADGSLLTVNGKAVGSRLIGQAFVDSKGDPLRQYFQPRPSEAGSAGYDPTSSAASNLGPESVVDVLPNPSVAGDTGTHSLLTQVCSRSLAVGRLEGVDGSRPFCTKDGVGAVLAVFWSGPGYGGRITRVVSVNQTGAQTPFLTEYRGVRVEPGAFGADYSRAQLIAVRGDAPAHPAVPADAVSASGSGLDPEISPAYAAIQERRVAEARGVPVTAVAALVKKYTVGRDLGFLGEPRVNVLLLNFALDRSYPAH